MPTELKDGMRLPFPGLRIVRTDDALRIEYNNTCIWNRPAWGKDASDTEEILLYELTLHLCAQPHLLREILVHLRDNASIERDTRGEVKVWL